MKKIMTTCLCLFTIAITAQITKVEAYQVGTTLDFYIGQCGNSIPEATGKLSFCDAAGNLAVVRESTGFNARGALNMVPNYYNNDEIYITQNGVSIYKEDGSWDNIPNEAFANPEVTFWNNTGTALEGVALPSGELLLIVNGASYLIHTYNMDTKVLTTSSASGPFFPGIRKIIYDEVSDEVYVLTSATNNIELHSYDPNTGLFTLLSSDSNLNNLNSVGGTTVTARFYNGNIYVANSFGLFIIDTTQTGYPVIQYNTDNILPFNKINDFVFTPEGDLWMACSAFNNNSGGLVKFDESNQTVETYTLENPGASVVDLLFQTLAIDSDGIIYTTASNFDGLVQLDLSSGSEDWQIITSPELETLGVPTTYTPNEIYNFNGKIYYITNDFSSTPNDNYEVIIKDNTTWTGRNDNAPGNISAQISARFEYIYERPDGGLQWVNPSDNILVNSTANNEFTINTSFLIPNRRGVVDLDNNYIGQIGGPTGFDVGKIITPAFIPYEQEGNDQSIAQFGDQIWAFDRNQKIIEVYAQNQRIETYNLDPSLTYTSYFESTVDGQGVFWSLKNLGGNSQLLRYDPAANMTSEIVLSEYLGTIKEVIPSPQGGIWCLGTSKALYYQGGQEYVFDAVNNGFGTIQDGIVDTEGVLHLETGAANTLVSISDPTGTPAIDVTIFDGNTGLLPAMDFFGSSAIALDSEGAIWVHARNVFFKIIDGATAPSYRTGGVSNVISGRVYVDLNDNEQYDDGEEVLGQPVSIVQEDAESTTFTNQNGMYFYFPRTENVTYQVSLPSLQRGYYSSERVLDVAVTTIDQDYENNDFELVTKDYESLYFKTPTKEGAWGFERTGFDNTFTSVITNMSSTKTFSELDITYLFKNEEDGELPEITDVVVSKLTPDGAYWLTDYIAINPRNHKWILTGIAAASTNVVELDIAENISEVTGERRVMLSIPEILPFESIVIELKTGLFDPALTGTKIIFTPESVNSPDFEDEEGLPFNEPIIIFPEEQRDFTIVPLPSEDLNSPYLDPSEPADDFVFIDPSNVYVPGPNEVPIFSSFDPNDKLVDGGNALEVNETNISQKWLNYTVRFENEGNFSAKDIYILDQLDENLLPNSIVLLESSHDVVIDVLPYGENEPATLRFSFNDIFLPFEDGENDGWVKFAVRVKEDISEGTIVENTAAIYFDQNPPIITNTIQNQFMTPADEIAPTVICQNITLELDENGEALLEPSDIDDGSTDNVEIVLLSLDTTVFSCNELGENTVTLTATDAAGNSASCEANVTVVDTTSPLVDCQNIEIILSENGTASITIDDVMESATDNCAIESTLLSNTDFTCEDTGINEVIISVTDTSGNTATCTAIVTVVDEVLPVAVCQDITVVLDETGIATITADDVDGGSIDNCAIINKEVDTVSFTCDDLGTQTVMLFVMDAAGNESICEAQVTVVDTTAPNVVCQDITVVLDENGEATITPFDIDVNDSTDNCGIVDIILSQELFTCNDLGNNTITFTAVDASGNEANCTAQVTVTETQAPIFDTATLPTDQQRDADENDEYIMENFTVGIIATDNCTNVTFAQVPAAGVLLSPDLYPVVITAIDESGNEAEYQFMLQVNTILSIHPIEESFELLLYPNPATNEISISSEKAIETLLIFDVAGREMLFERNGSNIDISNFKSGVYLVQVSTGDTSQTLQFIKK